MPFDEDESVSELGLIAPDTAGVSDRIEGASKYSKYMGASGLSASGWKVVKQHRLGKTFLFPDFRAALDFLNRVGAVAEDVGHHPDLHLAWGRVDVETWTPDAGGLTEKDYDLAAKIDQQFFQR